MGFYSTSLGLVGIYVGLNILINLFLAYRVSANRVRTNVMTGTGSDEKLYNASRAHVTNVEYTPIGLIGLVVLHLLAASIYVMHVVGLALTIGRILHAIGVSRTGESTPPRLVGTLLTWIALLVAGIACLWYAIV
ncbi:MAG: MAPEG family protein [Parvibaculaceae bacterium]|nr:MAPEG family protein [Parvibaculaceae bacterium]